MAPGSRKVFVVCAAMLAADASRVVADTTRVPNCSPSGAAAAAGILPKISYRCPQNVNDYEAAILSVPQRISALDAVLAALAKMNSPLWWTTSVNELNSCYPHGKAGTLTVKEKKELAESAWSVPLQGDDTVRLVYLRDPCYQKNFEGSVLFLLVREGKTITVSKLLDGYFSRLTNSVDFFRATLQGHVIIAVLARGEAGPYTNRRIHLFEIDPSSHQPRPYKIFSDGGEAVNELYSEDLLGADDTGEDPSPLQLISGQKFAHTFVTYEEGGEEELDASGRHLRRSDWTFDGQKYRKDEVASEESTRSEGAN